MDRELLTTSQVARHLGVSAERVRQLAQAGELPCQMTSLGRLYAQRDVDALARRRAEGMGRQPAA